MRLGEFVENIDVKLGAVALTVGSWLVYSFRLGHRIGLMEEQLRQQGHQLERLTARIEARFDKGIT